MYGMTNLGGDPFTQLYTSATTLRRIPTDRYLAVTRAWLPDAWAGTRFPIVAPNGASFWGLLQLLDEGFGRDAPFGPLSIQGATEILFARGLLPWAEFPPTWRFESCSGEAERPWSLYALAFVAFHVERLVQAEALLDEAVARFAALSPAALVPGLVLRTTSLPATPSSGAPWARRRLLARLPLRRNDLHALRVETRANLQRYADVTSGDRRFLADLEAFLTWELCVRAGLDADTVQNVFDGIFPTYDPQRPNPFAPLVALRACVPFDFDRDHWAVPLCK